MININNQLFISVLVSGIIMLMSVFIMRSKKMHENDKMKSIILLLVFFSVITILKEYKRQPIKNNSENKVTAQQLQKQFFSDTKKDHIHLEQLQLLLSMNDLSLEHITSLIKNEKEEKIMKMLFSRKGRGKTYLFKQLVQYLHRHELPVWYLDVQEEVSSFDQFIKENRWVNPLVMDAALDRLNHNKFSPLIVIDNAHLFIHQDQCQMCSYIRNLFDTKQVNLILISDSIHKINFFQNNHDLYQRIQMTPFQEMSMSQKYSLLESEEIEIDKEGLKACESSYLLSYGQMINMPKGSIQEVCKGYASEEKGQIDSQTLQVMQRIAGFGKEGATYGQLKAGGQIDLLDQLDTAIQQDYLMFSQGRYLLSDENALRLVK